MQPATGPFRPLSILKYSSKLTGANLVRFILDFPTSIVVARLLGPDLLGAVSYLTLWSFYALQIRPGLFNAAVIEIPSLVGQKRLEKAVQVQNTALTVEGLFLLVPATVMLVAGILQPAGLLRVGLWVTALAYVLAGLYQFVSGIQYAYQRYNLVAKMALATGVTPALFTLLTVHWIGPYALLLAPAVYAVIGFLTFRMAGVPLRFSVVWDATEVRRLVGMGIMLVVFNILYQGFRMTGRTAVATWLPLADLGYFAFALTIVNYSIQVVSDFHNVLQPILWNELGRQESPRAIVRPITNTVLLLLLTTCAGANLAQAVFGTLVQAVVPKFAPSVPVFEILIFNLACSTAAIIPIDLLVSTTVNKGKVNTMVWAGGLAVNAALAILVVKYFHAGIVALALSTVAAQIIVAGALFGVTHRDLFERAGDALRFYGSMSAILVTAIGVYGAFHLGVMATSGPSDWTAVGVRLLFTVTVWLGAGAMFYGPWRSGSAVATS